MSFLINHMATMTALQTTTMMMQHNHRRQREEDERRKKKQEEELKKSNYDATKITAPEVYKPKHAKKEDLTEEEINLMSI